ncbi:hypothetical protein ALI144C_41715 [Actinosynnema sp. ALI-1.44]|uniref:HAD family hydrolase n=1 Tax=Actinosynnema sp. ALI-1.44 TaxID=1933779 RepID=UPI00097BC342|nr:HAD family hydrolase [Actinosynnema sp. ALI-1.44]ONI75252.1 hypothetical protein ALI144C_41715 [Actinosynnema sp. ALI-1.44]
MAPKPHIVWDWNGTLVGDSRALIESVIAAFAMTGLGAVTVRDHQRLFTRPISAFFGLLAGRTLNEREYARLREKFDQVYDGKRERIGLTPGAHEALETWSKAGGTQSILSMCPQDALTAHVRQHRVTEFFTSVDGFPGTGPDTKAWHLRNHLTGLDPRTTVLIGDTTDDVLAARDAGITCVVYHQGPDSLQSIDHFDGLDAHVVPTLSDAIARVAHIR